MVRRKKGKEHRFAEQNVQFTTTGGPTVNVWYSIGPKGKGRLFLAENHQLYDSFGNKLGRGTAHKGFDSESYCNLLEHHALPSIKRQMGEETWYFVQDNASIHTAKLADKSERKIDRILRMFRVQDVKWPAKSCDLNCIENVHPLIQREMDAYLSGRPDRWPKNKKELFRIVLRSYQKVDNELVKKIYFKFLERCLEVYRLKGRNNFDA